MVFTIGQLLRGILANKYVGYLLLLIAVLVGFYSLYHMGYKKGIDITETKYKLFISEAKEQQRQREHALLLEINQSKEQAERQLNQLTLLHQKQLEDNQRETDAIIESYRAESRRLHIEIDTRRMSVSDRESACDTRQPTALVRAPLSERSAEFLIRQAGKADKVGHELNLCKKTLQQYHDVIAEYNQLIQASNQQALKQTKK